MMKELDWVMLMNDSSLSKPSLSSITLSDNDDEPEIQVALISEALIH